MVKGAWRLYQLKIEILILQVFLFIKPYDGISKKSLDINFNFIKPKHFLNKTFKNKLF